MFADPWLEGWGGICTGERVQEQRVKVPVPWPWFNSGSPMALFLNNKTMWRVCFLLLLESRYSSSSFYNLICILQIWPAYLCMLPPSWNLYILNIIILKPWWRILVPKFSQRVRFIALGHLTMVLSILACVFFFGSCCWYYTLFIPLYFYFFCFYCIYGFL